MDATPKGNRLHIAIFGRTNVGKSSLLNYILGQDLAITSPVAGTTTDVVEKAVELLPLGPVLFLDTAGLDDTSALAAQRIRKTSGIFNRADVILLVTEPGRWSRYEEQVIAQAAEKKIPLIAVVNKIDLAPPSDAFLQEISAKAGRVVTLSATGPDGREEAIGLIKRYLIEVAPDDFMAVPGLLGDLLPSKGLVLMVVPIDIEAPKGRLILPQVQAIRDALDSDAAALVVKETGLLDAMGSLSRLPDLCVCDSQAIRKVAAEVPPEVPCTTFSILFARQKGNLAAAAEGAAAIASLRPGDKVLIAEACSHHPLQDDIGRVKIPRWLRQSVGGELDVEVTAGRDYPEDLSRYRLIIHCGGCMLNRREMLSRMQAAREAHIPITNYGLAISHTQGVIRRVLSPFPSALLAYERASRNLSAFN